ncbi:MAG TPA: ferritin family protein [Candidatus Brocadiales bacterium]|nr:ferritin family protein [Candidatus Brocadiales bacterium]
MNTILEIIEKAIAEEKKARDFYSKMASQMSDKGARLKLEVMAATEQKHHDFLTSWYIELCGHEPQILESSPPKADEIVKIRRPAKEESFQDIIGIIVEAEKHAYTFYKEAALKATEPEHKKVFEMLATMEQSHVEQFKGEYQYASEKVIRFADEDIPWMMEL